MLFTALDPIGPLGGDPDEYGYCLDDPVNGIDPVGLFDLEATEKAAEFVLDAAQSVGDFNRNYEDMKEANRINADKYFHCKANCEATKRGLGGRFAAWAGSEARELYGQWVKGDPPEDKAADQDANRYGRKVTGSDSCEDHCNRYRPDSLEDKW